MWTWVGCVRVRVRVRVRVSPCVHVYISEVSDFCYKPSRQISFVRTGR